MKTLSYILRIAITLTLLWIGYVIFDTFYFDNSLIANILPLTSALTCFLIILLLLIIQREINSINPTSLLLGSLSFLFTLTMFFLPLTVLALWSFALSVFTLFIMHGIFLLTGSHEGGKLHKTLLGLAAGFFVMMLLFKIQLSSIHIIVLTLCLAITVTSALSIFGKKI